jgi:hypothetical protein
MGTVRFSLPILVQIEQRQSHSALPRTRRPFPGLRFYGSTYLAHAGILDVHVASQAGIEEQVPPGVMIVVVHVHAVALPFPIAAAIEVVGSNHPIRIIEEHHTT